MRYGNREEEVGGLVEQETRNLTDRVGKHDTDEIGENETSPEPGRGACAGPDGEQSAWQRDRVRVARKARRSLDGTVVVVMVAAEMVTGIAVHIARVGGCLRGT